MAFQKRIRRMSKTHTHPRRDTIRSAVRACLARTVASDGQEQPEDVVFREEIEARLGFAPSTARKWMAAGRLGPAFLIGRRLAIRRASFHAAIRAMEADAIGNDDDAAYIAEVVREVLNERDRHGAGAR